jgi:hypothetical protein
MFFGRIAAQLLAFAAIAGVFGEIPIVSEWAFWFMVGAYLLWLGVNRMHTTRRIKLQLMVTIVLWLPLWGSSSEYQASVISPFG